MMSLHAHEIMEIEQEIRRMADTAAPNVLDSVLHELGKEQSMEQTLTPTLTLVSPAPAKTTKPLRLLRSLGSLAAAAALIFTAQGAYFNYHVDSVVGIDVNPSLELRVNRKEQVLSATALNEDAKLVMEGMDLKNVDLDVAVNAIIGSMVKNGYLGSGDNAINICVENNDTARGEALSQKLSSEINALLSDNALIGQVMTQTQNEDVALEKLAEEHSVSLGKVTLAEMAVSASGGTLVFDDAVKMSVKELWAVVYPETFISLDAAKAAAVQAAGLTIEEAVFTKDRLYQKGTVYIYDLELCTDARKCSFEIDAVSGEVLDYTTRDLGNNSEQTVTPDLITDVKAQSIAYADAGVETDQVTLKKCKLSEDDGAWQYEVDFKVGKDEYEYEIDAVNGTILSRDIELAQTTQKTEGSGKTETSAPELLSAKQALAAACTDAGVKERDITLIQCELDEDDGLVKYDVEFKMGYNEYDYEINATSGAILSRDVELYEDAAEEAAETVSEKSAVSEGDASAENRPTEVEFITADKALRLACQAAGIKRANVGKTECELNEDDGKWVYEVSFDVGPEEYEFEIDAASGEVLFWETDV